MEPFEIEILGVCIKKNQWRPKGKGIGITNKSTIDLLDRMAMQVPGMYRDLNLEHPDMDFYFTYQRAAWDRDGAVTTMLDILGRSERWGMRVIRDDNIRRCNGRLTIHPAVRGDMDGCRIVITPRETQGELIHDEQIPEADDQVMRFDSTGAPTRARQIAGAEERLQPAQPRSRRRAQ